jgi:hypothetical protein
MNSEMIWKIQKKIVKWYGNQAGRIVISYGQNGGKASWIVKRYEKHGKNPSWIVKRYGKYGRKLWNDMENMEGK